MFAGLLAGVGRLTLVGYRDAARKRRERFIHHYVFPDAIGGGVRRRDDDVAKVLNGLREYFAICNAAGRRFVSMPSQAADVAWHELIVFTRAYRELCEYALGGYLHHTPAAALPGRTLVEEGLRRAWWLSCRREHLDPKNAARLPLLFTIDSDLAEKGRLKFLYPALRGDIRRALCALARRCWGAECLRGRLPRRAWEPVVSAPPRTPAPASTYPLEQPTFREARS